MSSWKIRKYVFAKNIFKEISENVLDGGEIIFKEDKDELVLALKIRINENELIFGYKYGNLSIHVSKEDTLVKIFSKENYTERLLKKEIENFLKKNKR